MFEKRRIGSDEWEEITAREALEILHGVTYQSVYVLRVRLTVDVSMLTASSAPVYAIAEDAETIGAMANDAINPNKIPFTGYSVGSLGIDRARPVAEDWGISPTPPDSPNPFASILNKKNPAES